MVLTGCKFYCRQSSNARNKMLFNRNKASDVNNCDVNALANSTVAIPIDDTVHTVPPSVSHLSSNGYYGFVAVDTMRGDSKTFGGTSVDVNKQKQSTETTTANDIMDVEQQSDLDERKCVGMTSLGPSSDQNVAACLNGCIARRKRIFSDDQIFDKTTSKRIRFDTDDQYFRTNGDDNQFSSMDHEDIPIPIELNQPVSNISFHHSSDQYQPSNNVIDPVNSNKNLEIPKLSSELECYVNGFTNQHSNDRYSHELNNENFTNIDFIQVNEDNYYEDRLYD